MKTIIKIFSFIFSTLLPTCVTILNLISLIQKQATGKQTLYYESLSSFFNLSSTQTQILLFILFLLFLAWSIKSIAKLNKKRLDKKQYEYSFYGFVSPRRPDRTGEIDFHGFVWSYDLYADYNGRDFEVEVSSSPLCTECKSEMIETRTFFGRFKSQCPACRRTVKGSRSNYTLSKIVSQKATREIKKKERA
ncbi:hypothetical protein SAMN05421503_1469 [Terribacillus aidingensis]|uniref:Uncharacterized protein n=1 Tax=Terribacillus aidingensis TaxID=586416 RepID=A0A285NKG4_9BACI|nr:hypothetical protein [Terribacillus aidingensis]SNZ10014.1 hypothetical protein SAMN05421503_1469 [Terribacillus aidingensis]